MPAQPLISASGGPWRRLEQQRARQIKYLPPEKICTSPPALPRLHVARYRQSPRAWIWA